MRGKDLFVLLCLIALVAAMDQIRFRDGPMMREHHNHQVPNSPNLTVHLIPHSHDDVGWLKTVDNYFYGGDQSTQWAAVQFTIDTVVSELTAHPEYHFVIVEMAFLYRWWNGATEEQRTQMKNLVKNGQLQFINGGWCMSDEATPYYQDVIDQMSIGLRWLKDTLDFVPDVAWHIDPFGHQASSASMFNKMGFQSFFFARIDYQDKQLRMSQKSLEMIWKPRKTIPDSKNYIFTHVNYYHYSPPPGFCFDLVCKNQPIKDDESLEDYNVDQRSLDLVNYFKSQALHFRSNNLMHTLGEDFQFANARMWYKNIDKLMNYINTRPEFNVKIIYSTPSKYIKAIQAEGNTYPTKTDDFFPYADYQHAYWTGYFVSRVAVKGFVRDFGRWIQAVRKQIAQLKIRGDSPTILSESKALQQRIWDMQTSMGILQHHDAVSGTEKQKVADDYIATAIRTINKFKPIYTTILKQSMQKQINQNIDSSIYFNMFWNQTANQTGILNYLSANKTILLSLYNSGSNRDRTVRISVPANDLKIINSQNQPIHGDVLCVNTYDDNCELVLTLKFPQSNSAYIKIMKDLKSPTAKVVKLKELTVIDSAKQFKLTNTASIKITKSSQKFDLTLDQNIQSFYLNYNYYGSYAGTGQKSGAYIFRPTSDTSSKYSSIKAIHYAQGTVMTVISLQGDHTYTKLYFSKIDNYVNKYGFQIQTHINAISVADKIGKEITMNFVSGYSNNKTFYTDSNGLEEQVRIVDYRPTWPLVVNEAVSGNYYPINSHIGIQDVNTNKKLTIVTDRSQGGTVIKNGQIQIMIHRRTLEDDARGVGEPLNEGGLDGKGLVQDVRHYVVFGESYRSVQMANDQKVAIAIMPSVIQSFSKHSSSSVVFPVPQNIKLYLRPFTDNSYLVRLQSFSSSSVSVSIPSGWEVTELTLSANQLQSDWEKAQYTWKTENSEQKNSTPLREQQKHQQQQISFLRKILNIFKNLLKIGNSFESEQPQIRRSTSDSIKLDFLQIRTFKLIKSS